MMNIINYVIKKVTMILIQLCHSLSYVCYDAYWVKSQMIKLSFLEIRFDGMIGRHLVEFPKKWVPDEGYYWDCPEATFVDGFRIKYHPMMGIDVIELICSTKKGEIAKR